MKQVLVMASGGIESTTLIAQLQSEGNYVIGLYFDVGLPSTDHQYHYSKYALSSAQGRLEYIDITGLKRTLLGFIPPEQLGGEADKICPDIEFIPIYMSLGVYYAESMNFQNTKSVDSIYVGFTKDQMDSNRENFFRLISPALASYQSSAEEVNIEVPFSDMTKSDVIKIGHGLGVDYSKTWSCIHGEEAHCGVCDRCEDRKKAFADAKVQDTTRYK